MCIICLLLFAGEAALRGATGACGARQGEYNVEVSPERRRPLGHDWRSLLCCFSKSGGYSKRGKMVLLHGVLYLHIESGRDLPDLDTTWFRSSKDVSDPYVTVDTCFSGKKTCRVAKTSIINDSLNPHWDEKFRIELCHEADSLLFSVKDDDLLKIENMGYMSIRAEDLISEKQLSGWYPIISKSGNPAGHLNVTIQFKSVASITRSNEVPDTAFPLRRGCDVSLYQDAHTPTVSPVIDIPTGSGETYKPPQLWLDISAALNAAEDFIYIVGWSIKAEINLRRDIPDAESLGNLLKRKAADGVRVLLMVWNEALSTDLFDGIMGTHDEETRLFFEDTEVEVLLAPRQKGYAKFLETSFVATMFTHHQKCVIVDTPTDSEKRGLVAFVGGIDLTDGRWDTPEHLLYKSLLTEHCNDFYNGCCNTTQTVGPRQPWHDIHARVQGSVVLDLISNFVERWRKQAPEREQRLVSLSEERYDLEWKNKDPNPWSVQFFRSINSDSAIFQIDILDRLLKRKGRIYDNSIHRAYVHQIRRSKNFLYLENQYFLGSSHGWLIQEAKCPHLIPIEITTKICNAIKSQEPYRAYVVIPLHPEGDPSTSAVQEILHWQHITMEMMYRKIAKALKSVRSQDHPTDYLSFFCLGKRESPEDVPDGLDDPQLNSDGEKIRKCLRFMIYVHSKLAIFDDEYAIIGSANINERSMSGNRDSEMAVGVFQEGITKEDCEETPIRGKVHEFRLSLWSEHCGQHMEEHMNPSSASCMSAMRSMGERNLKSFLKDEPSHENSHLLLYPVQVSTVGHVSFREDCRFFPDTQASVLGKNSVFLPNSLTT